MKFTQILALAVVAQAITVTQKGDGGIVDATSPSACEPRLWLSRDEMNWQMDQFSRHFLPQNLKNSLEIAGKIGASPPKVGAWELNDKAFSFPRVRRYDFVNNNLDMLEHFQDNLNTNISNEVNQENFIRTAKQVVENFAERYHDGEWDSPANHDPREEAKK